MLNGMLKMAYASCRRKVSFMRPILQFPVSLSMSELTCDLGCKACGWVVTLKVEQVGSHLSAQILIEFLFPTCHL